MFNEVVGWSLMVDEYDALCSRPTSAAELKLRGHVRLLRYTFVSAVLGSRCQVLYRFGEVEVLSRRYQNGPLKDLRAGEILEYSANVSKQLFDEKTIAQGLGTQLT